MSNDQPAWIIGQPLVYCAFNSQAYHKLAKEYHPDKNPEAGEHVSNPKNLQIRAMTYICFNPFYTGGLFHCYILD